MTIPAEEYEIARERLTQIREEMSTFAGTGNLWYGQAAGDPKYRELTAERAELNRVVETYEADRQRAVDPDPTVVWIP